MQQRAVAVGDFVFDVALAGADDAEPVLMLHGFPQTSWCWREVAPALTDAGYRVLAPDQRGYSPGARPDDLEDYAMPRLVRDALGVLDGTGVDTAHVVGHDWGAAVAWQLAARHPDRVATLTSVSVPHPRAFVSALRDDDDQRERSAYMRIFADSTAAEAMLLEDDAAQLRAALSTGVGVDVDRYVDLLGRRGVLRRCLLWYAAQDRRDIDDLPRIDVPTLYVWSTNDAALGRTAAERTAQHVAGPYRFEVLDGVSHWVPEEAPEALAEHLLRHLRSYPIGTGSR